MRTFIFCNFSDRVAFGRQLDLPVYFGDAGSREVKPIQSYSHVIAIHLVNQSVFGLSGPP